MISHEDLLLTVKNVNIFRNNGSTVFSILKYRSRSVKKYNRNRHFYRIYILRTVQFRMVVSHIKKKRGLSAWQSIWVIGNGGKKKKNRINCPKLTGFLLIFIRRVDRRERETNNMT